MLVYREELSDDEVFALVVSLGFAVLGGTLWFVRGLRVSRFGVPKRALAALLLAPLAALAVLWIILARFAAVEVRTDGRYQFLFVVMGATWVFLLPRMLAFIGVSYRDDALERRNGAAAIAITGSILGLALLFAGSNMGEGPSIWNTVATACAATAVLFAIVFVLAFSTALGDSIAIERDLASGARLAGLFVGCGAVLGRASAGNWVSVDAMLADLFALGWPVLLLMWIAIALERVLRPSLTNPRPSLWMAGVLPAAAYVLSSFLYVAVLPDWRGTG